MHIIGILTGLAVLAFWGFRAMGSARDSGVTAARQRKKRWNYDSVGKSGPLDTLKTPHDAATALLVMLARNEVTGETGATARQRIHSLLQDKMQLDADDAEIRMRKIETTLRQITQVDTLVSPVTTILRDSISRSDARDLYAMMESVLALEPTPSQDKLALMRAYKERMGLED